MAFNSVPQPIQCPGYSLAHRGPCARVCVRRAVVPDTQRPNHLIYARRCLYEPYRMPHGLRKNRETDYGRF